MPSGCVSQSTYMALIKARKARAAAAAGPMPFKVYNVKKNGEPYAHPSSEHATFEDADARREYLARLNPKSAFVVLEK